LAESDDERRRGGRRAVLHRTLAVIGVLVVLATLAEFGFGAAAEYRISRTVRSAIGARTDPEVSIGAASFLLSLHNWEHLSIAVPWTVDAHRIRLESELWDVHLADSRPIWPNIGPDVPITVAGLRSQVRLDPSTFGEMMHISDLEVHAPPPDWPGAGSPNDGYLMAARKVILTGTVPLATAADPKRTVNVSVTADFSTWWGSLRVRATDVYNGPADHGKDTVSGAEVPKVLALFSADLPRITLPFGLLATAARVENDSVVLFTEVIPATTTLGDFYRVRR
jgi:hypothetical protein